MEWIRLRQLPDDWLEAPRQDASYYLSRNAPASPLGCTQGFYQYSSTIP